MSEIIEIQGVKYFIPDSFKKDYIYRFMQLSKKVFEHELINFLMNYIYLDSVVIDVGGHIGNHSIQFAKKAKKVFAFEAMEEICKIFEKNISLNNIENVELFKIAVADEECKLKIDELRSKLVSNTGATFLLKDKEGSIFASTIDEILLPILKDRVSVIKFDIEEMEYFAILGAIKIIKKFHPVIYTEIFRQRIGAEQKLKNISEVLNPLGYKNHYKKEFSGDIWMVE